MRADRWPRLLCGTAPLPEAAGRRRGACRRVLRALPPRTQGTDTRKPLRLRDWRQDIVRALYRRSTALPRSLTE
jgi:hypothetical protein